MDSSFSNSNYFNYSSFSSSWTTGRRDASCFFMVESTGDSSDDVHPAYLPDLINDDDAQSCSSDYQYSFDPHQGDFNNGAESVVDDASYHHRDDEEDEEEEGDVVVQPWRRSGGVDFSSQGNGSRNDHHLQAAEKNRLFWEACLAN